MDRLPPQTPAEPQREPALSERGEEQIDAEPGDVVIVPPDVPHKFTNRGPGQSSLVRVHASQVRHGVAGMSANQIHLRAEQSNGVISIAERTMPARAPGPPLHAHAFDEAFYVLDGQLTFQLGNQADHG